MRAAGLAGAAVVALAAAGQAQSDVAIRLTSPAAGAYVAGPAALRAVIDPPRAASLVQSVSFFVNGRRVCGMTAPPFVCDWDFGARLEAHHVRVVANLRDGRRIADTVRTRRLDVHEEVDVDLVQVTAIVTDRQGHFVKGLPKEAFRVLENGVPHQVTFFAAETAPLEVLVAIDVSGSLKAFMPSVRAAAQQFLGALREEDDVTLLAFNENVFALARRQRDRAARLRAVERLAAWGGTALHDAIARGLQMLGRQQGRRALVVFTDGDDQSSITTLEALIRQVESSDATIYMIGQGRGTRSPALMALLERLARLSGGRAFFTDDRAALDVAFGQIVEELSNQYLLAYAPLDDRRDGAWRPIQVELPEHRGLRVRARQGYRAREDR
jgi:Ca-activated chloride channel homolog